jgi:hypothetical protein
MNGLTLKYVKPSLLRYELYHAAIVSNGLALQYIDKTKCKKKVYHALCVEAIKRNPIALIFVKKQKKELCDLAVRRYPPLISIVKKQTHTQAEIAIKYDTALTKWIRVMDIDLWLLAVKKNPKCLQYAYAQTPEMCFHALRDKTMRQYAKYGTNLPDAYYEWYRNNEYLKSFHLELSKYHKDIKIMCTKN